MWDVRVVVMVWIVMMISCILVVGSGEVGAVVRVGLIILDEAVLPIIPPPRPFDTPHPRTRSTDATLIIIKIISPGLSRTSGPFRRSLGFSSFK